MVILENTTPDTGGALGVTPMQLSEWDRMIKQQFNRSTHQNQQAHKAANSGTMINNLVGKQHY